MTHVPLAVLVVDDDPVFQILHSHYLKGDDNLVAQAHDGLQALEMQKTVTFDVILMDLDMPVMDGLEASRRIREWEAEGGRPRTPILAVTSHSESDVMRCCVSAGMDAHLPKPVLRGKLLETVRRFARILPRDESTLKPHVNGVVLSSHEDTSNS